MCGGMYVLYGVVTSWSKAAAAFGEVPTVPIRLLHPFLLSGPFWAAMFNVSV